MNTNISRVARVVLISFLLLTGSYHSAFAGRSVQTSAEFSPATLVVTKTADTEDGTCDSDCSLREAVNAAASGATIIFSRSLSGQTIMMSETINDSIRIDGKDLVIDGSSLGPNIRINGENMLIMPLRIDDYSTVILKNIDFINGVAGGGGAIFNEGDLTILNSTFSNNFSSSYGGAISNSGNLTISNSTFANNFSSSYGGAIDNLGFLTVTGSTFRDNVALDHGGAIYNMLSLTIKNSTFYNNSAAVNGGGIYDGSGGITILNSTFSDNSAALGGGIYYYASGLDLKNTILADSISGGDCYINTGTIISSTNNLIETNGSSEHACGTPVSTADPMLDGLADNGGPTQTMALQPGSPAIDFGDDLTCETTDQRGVARPHGDHCDIGAYEFAVIYVTPGGLISGSCASWAGACELQYALGLASAGNELWVKEGIYTPSGGSDRAVSFQIVDGVAVYGGFAGTETNRDDRDPVAYLTILSGDLNGDDGADFANNGENSYHVVTGSGTDNTAVLDGFTVRGGNANGDYPYDSGGGMYNNSGSPGLTNVTFSGNQADAGGGMYNENSSNPGLTNVTISDNTANYLAGGMFNDMSSPNLTEVTFSGNQADYGGGMLNLNSSPTLMTVTFSGNQAITRGGGMLNDGSSPVLTYVTFSGNQAEQGGGGMSNENSSSTSLTNVTFSGNSTTDFGGGMLNGDSSPSLLNVTFIGNQADYGGGMINGISIEAESPPTPSLTNVTFSGNLATTSGGGMHNGGSSPSLTNVTFSGNSATVEGGGMSNDWNSYPTLTNVIIADSTSGGDCVNDGTSSLDPASTNNLIEDPANACGLTNGVDENIIGSDPNLGPLADYGGWTETLALLPGSPAIDMGDYLNCPAADQRDVTRPLDGDLDGRADCDIGAYEYQTGISVFTVTFDANGGTGVMSPQLASEPTPLVANVFTRAGYTFAGWNTDPNGSGTAYANQDIYSFAVDLTLYAQWTINTYTLTYHGNGSDSGSPPVDGSSPYLEGATVTVLDSATLAKTNYTFAGWNTQADGLGTGYAPGDTFSMPAENVTLYARWTPTIYTLTLRSQAKYDGWILESGEFSGKGGSKNNFGKVLMLGDDALDKQYRVILSFNTAALPENAKITKVILKVRKAGVLGTNPMKTHNKLVVDIKMNKFYTKPVLQINDFQAQPNMFKAGGFSRKLNSGWYRAELLTGAHDYININGRTQFRLRFLRGDNDDHSADILKLYSGNAVLANRPKLIIKYYIE